MRSGGDKGHDLILRSHPSAAQRPRLLRCGDRLAAPGEGHDRVVGAVGLVVIVQRIVPPRAVLFLAVSEGGLPACRNHTRSASLPSTTLRLPNPTEKVGTAVAHFQAAASATTGGGFTEAVRTDEMVCESVKQRSDDFSDA